MIFKLFYLLFWLIYFMYIACFRPVDRPIESELPKNFQDLDFEYLEQQQVGVEGKCP
jgi:hypothetical protein